MFLFFVCFCLFCLLHREKLVHNNKSVIQCTHAYNTYNIYIYNIYAHFLSFSNNRPNNINYTCILYIYIDVYIYNIYIDRLHALLYILFLRTFSSVLHNNNDITTTTIIIIIVIIVIIVIIIINSTVHYPSLSLTLSLSHILLLCLI